MLMGINSEDSILFISYGGKGGKTFYVTRNLLGIYPKVVKLLLECIDRIEPDVHYPLLNGKFFVHDISKKPKHFIFTEEESEKFIKAIG